MLVTSIFFYFSKMFSTLLTTEIVFLETANLSSAYAFNLDEGKILSFGKELIMTQTPFKKKMFI